MKICQNIDRTLLVLHMLYSTLCHATLKLAPSILDSKPDTLESLQATSGGGGHTGELPDCLLPLSIENTTFNSSDYPCQKGFRRVSKHRSRWVA